jgi:nucleoside-diphosphate-sugar epimerase
MSEIKTCVITGGRGYLGSELMAYLQQAGWRTICASREAGPNTISYSLGGDWPPGSLEGVSVLVHCAYDFGPSDWATIYEKNVLGTRRLLDQARQAGIENIVTISSISAFPGCRSLYGKAKLLIEEETLAAGGVALRPGLIYGGSNEGMYGRLAKQARKKSVIPLLSGSACTQFLVHIEDLCGVIAATLSGQVSRSNPVLTVAHSEPWPLRRLLAALAGDRKVYFLHVPWQAIWVALRLAEMAGVRLAFKSDSVRSIVYQNPRPDLSWLTASKLPVRAFQPKN